MPLPQTRRPGFRLADVLLNFARSMTSRASVDVDQMPPGSGRMLKAFLCLIIFFLCICAGAGSAPGSGD